MDVREPAEEWQAICLLYTSGTRGNAKGVVYHHRGAYLNALGNALAFGLSARSVYLWTLPMFHCSGWTYTWAVTAVGGTHVCLRRVEPAAIFPAIATTPGHAPVRSTRGLDDADSRSGRGESARRPRGGSGDRGGGASVHGDRGHGVDGFQGTHHYGLTECYGPATLCAWQEEWDGLTLDERARMMARQGIPHPTLSGLMVADPVTLEPVPKDGPTMGEILLCGNTIMKGYLRNSTATKKPSAAAGPHGRSGGVA